MVKRGRSLALTAINDGNAVKIQEWEKQEERSGHMQGPQWGEFLTGFLNRDMSDALYLVKWGSVDSPYEQRKLHENNSQRARGSRGDILTEEEAREWIKENDLSEDKLDDFLKAHEIIQDLRN